MTNADVARVLEQLAVMLELDGANVFRVRAYREGARIIGTHGESVQSLVSTEGALEALPGIGKDLAGKIRDLAGTGKTELFTEMERKYPLSLVALTELHGLGPKRVKTLFETLGVRDRAQLEAAATTGRLRDLPGFGAKVEQNVIKALATAEQWAGRMLLAAVWPMAHAIADRVRQVKGVRQVELAGSFRRRKETVGDLDVLVTGGQAAAVMAAFTKHTSVAEVLGAGETKSSVRLTDGLQVDLRHVPEASFGAALMYFTGSKEHNIELRRIAIDKGWSLNEYGLTKGDRVVASRTEEDIYKALGLAWVPPELREMHGEIDMARDGTLPELVTLDDLHADLHMHTTRSDGRDSIDAMVESALARGYEYIAITEHSKALAMANGFDAARVRRSTGEIAAARKRHPKIHILHGLEVDILGDGELDLDDDTLAILDWVIVSIHSRFEMEPEAATQRVLRALANPFVHAMGHPTGRLIGSRNPVPFDVERVATFAASQGVALEINASPDRLDLSDAHARLAKSLGACFVIDTDAHATAHLDNLKFGVFQARRAGLTAADCMNARGWPAFESWRGARRAGRRPSPPTPARAARPRPKSPARPARKPAAASDGRGSRRTAAGTAKPAPRPRKPR